MTDQITDLGVIVNDREGMDKSNDHSERYNTEEAVIPVRIPHNMFNRLLKASEFHGYPNLEAYCAAKLVETLTTKIGAAYIDSPTQMSGVDARKITGSSNSGIVKRAD